MDSIGIPQGLQGLGVAGIIIVLLFGIATGRLLFKWQVDRLFKDKDDLIALQAKKIEDDKSLIPTVVKILEAAHKAKVAPDDD